MVSFHRDLKECANLSKYVSADKSSSYTKRQLMENEEDDIDLVPRRRAPPPPNQSTSLLSTMLSHETNVPEIHKANPGFKRPTEPPPPAPNVLKMGSPFR